MSSPSQVPSSSIAVVIVLFHCTPEGSSAYLSLKAALQASPYICSHVEVILYDNSPDPLRDWTAPPWARYVHAKENLGLSGAYNYALDFAVAGSHEWMLTMDQDTRLPVDFLARMFSYAEDLEPNASIAAIVPRLVENGTVLSPSYVMFNRSRAMPKGFVGIPTRQIYAYNSASLWRVNALKQIGGFSRYFWLDYLDHWLHQKSYNKGMHVFVAGDLLAEHELSLRDYSSRITETRYRNLLGAESAFVDIHKGFLERLALTGRLACRILKLRIRRCEPTLLAATCEMLGTRLRKSRHDRISSWKRLMENRISADPLKDRLVATDHPRKTISVCMAVYNGERFIKAQLQSILCQLASTDEVVIANDGSRDRTLDIINEFHDERIRVIGDGVNRGVLAAFERAIQEASGDIIFLSDQDDSWAPDKVAEYLFVFDDHPEVNVVVGDAAIINEDDLIVEGSNFSRRRFRSGLIANLVHSRYIGCTMAFRSSLRSSVLPFPKELDVLHDIWIGTANSVLGGKTWFIDKPLTLYRRHGGNVTGVRKLPLRRQIRLRTHLVWGLSRLKVRNGKLSRFAG